MDIQTILAIVQAALQLANTIAEIMLEQIRGATPEQKTAMAAAQVTLLQNQADMIKFWQDVVAKLKVTTTDGQ